MGWKRLGEAAEQRGPEEGLGVWEEEREREEGKRGLGSMAVVFHTLLHTVLSPEGPGWDYEHDSSLETLRENQSQVRARWGSLQHSVPFLSLPRCEDIGNKMLKIIERVRERLQIEGDLSRLDQIIFPAEVGREGRGPG